MREPVLFGRLRELMAHAPLVVAHRGNSSVFPENTLPAFHSALELGADLVELDFHACADGTLVCLHDDTLDRTTNARTALGGTDLPVAAQPWSQVRRLDAGRWKGTRHRGTRVPSLREALRCITPRAIAMVEHKAGTPEALLALLGTRRLRERVLVQSFDWKFLARLRGLAPDLALAALGEGALTPRRLRLLPRTGARMVHWDFAALSPQDVAALHRRGQLVCAYTVDANLALVGAVLCGLDAITTNHPARLRKLLELF
jgi:glycerophosphoryl diester phosphodiesterase